MDWYNVVRTPNIYLCHPSTWAEFQQAFCYILHSHILEGTQICGDPIIDAFSLRVRKVDNQPPLSWAV